MRTRKDCRRELLHHDIGSHAGVEGAVVADRTEFGEGLAERAAT